MKKISVVITALPIGLSINLIINLMFANPLLPLFFPVGYIEAVLIPVTACVENLICRKICGTSKVYAFSFLAVFYAPAIVISGISAVFSAD